MKCEVKQPTIDNEPIITEGRSWWKRLNSSTSGAISPPIRAIAEPNPTAFVGVTGLPPFFIKRLYETLRNKREIHFYTIDESLFPCDFPP